MKIGITHEELYYLLNKKQGNVGHWPHESPWEIMLGAFLVQNTTWHNTQLSLKKIGDATLFDPESISKLEPDELVPLIYSSGFHKSKSNLISTWFKWLAEFNFDKQSVIEAYPTSTILRNHLLTFKGIGNETADVLMLYVFDQKCFIADNYARKLFAGLGCPAANDYLPLKHHVEKLTELELFEWQDFHGQILEYGKHHLVGKGPHQSALFEQYFLEV